MASTILKKLNQIRDVIEELEAAFPHENVYIMAFGMGVEGDTRISLRVVGLWADLRVKHTAEGPVVADFVYETPEGQGDIKKGEVWKGSTKHPKVGVDGSVTYVCDTLARLQHLVLKGYAEASEWKSLYEKDASDFR